MRFLSIIQCRKSESHFAAVFIFHDFLQSKTRSGERFLLFRIMLLVRCVPSILKLMMRKQTLPAI